VNDRSINEWRFIFMDLSWRQRERFGTSQSTRIFALRQLTFLISDFVVHHKTTRRERLLAKMQAVVPWVALVALAGSLPRRDDDLQVPPSDRGAAPVKARPQPAGPQHPHPIDHQHPPRLSLGAS
jgi:hypothetical protein